MLMTGSGLLTLVLAEFGLQLAGVRYPTSETGIVPHPIWHHWHRQQFSFEYYVAAEGYYQPVRFNEHGMRDSRPVFFRRSPDVFRVAVLGDSFAEAMQVGEDEAFCRRLERHLSEYSGGRVEVINFGCSGFSSLLELVMLRYWVPHFSPDLVICLHHFSDITEDCRLRKRCRYDGGLLVAVEPTSTGRRRKVERVLEWSQIYRLCRYVQKRHRRPHLRDPSVSLQRNFDAIVHEPYTAEDEQAFTHSLSAVLEMHEFLHHRGVPFLVVLIPIGSQVEPVEPHFARRLGYRYMAGGRRLEHRGYQDRVTSFCHRHGIDYLDLLDGFRQANPVGRPELYLPRDQHWTPAGHDLAARLTAQRIRSSDIDLHTQFTHPASQHAQGTRRAEHPERNRLTPAFR